MALLGLLQLARVIFREILSSMVVRGRIHSEHHSETNFQKNCIKRPCRTAKNTLGKRVCKCRSFCYYRNYTHLFASAAGESVQIQRESVSANTSVTTTTVTLMCFNRHYLQKTPHILIDQSGFQPNYSHFKWKILLTLSQLKPVSQQWLRDA